MRRRVAIIALLYVTIVVVLTTVGRSVPLPADGAGLDASFGSLNAFLQQITGRSVNADIEVDYASAVALVHGQDPYAVTAQLLTQYDLPAWGVQVANPHPPTTVVLLVPLTLLGYENALAAWTVLMVLLVIATIRLVGVRPVYAVPLGLGLCLLFPATYAIGNVAPVIGFGIAVAYRYRDHPLLAAVGLVLAAAPKASGLLLVIPFLLAGRIRAAGWAVGLTAALAAVPLLFFAPTWSRYLDVGLESVALNAARDDNAAVVHLATGIGLPTAVTTLLLAGVAAVLALRTRDPFWPCVWLIVASLPIAWSYSMITLLPLFAVALRRPRPVTMAAGTLAVALAVACPPLGMWPTAVAPVIVLLAAIVTLGTPDRVFPISPAVIRVVGELRDRLGRRPSPVRPTVPIRRPAAGPERRQSASPSGRRPTRT